MVEEEGKSRIRDVFTVSAPITGQMMRVNLHAGDAVVKGKTIVASIRPAAPDASRCAGDARGGSGGRCGAGRRGSRRAQLRQAEAQLVFLKSELERAESWSEQRHDLGAAFEKARLDVDTAAAAVESARAALMVRERELERAEAALIENADERRPMLHRSQGAGLGPGAARADGKRTGGAGGNAARGDRRSRRSRDRGRHPVARCGADQAGRRSRHRRLGRAAACRAACSASILRPSPRFRPSASRSSGCPSVLDLDGAAWAGGAGRRLPGGGAHHLWKGEDLLAVPIGALFRQGGDWAVYAVEKAGRR